MRIAPGAGWHGPSGPPARRATGWLLCVLLATGQLGAQEAEPEQTGSASEPQAETRPETRPENDPGFDIEAARRQIEIDLSTQAPALEVEQALDVVAPDIFDESVAPVALRGAGERLLDLRSVERLRWQCRSEIGRRDVTLFGNGTVRLRSGLWSEPEMSLDELGPDQLRSYLVRLTAIQRSSRFRSQAASEGVEIAPAEDLGQVADSRGFGTLDGRWTETCQLRLQLPDQPVAELRMARLEVPSLEVAQLVAIADELAEFTTPLRSVPTLAADYQPIFGDLLRRRDGQLFRVIGVTDDGGGVELESLEEPIRIFYLLADLPALFIGLTEADAESSPPGEGIEPEVREPGFGGRL